MPEGEPLSHCTLCNAVPIPEDLELLPDLSICETQDLIDSSETMKQKVIYIAGYLTHKHSAEFANENVGNEMVSSDLLNELNRGGLRVPTLNMIFLFIVHLLYIQKSRRNCTKYFQSLIALVDTPFATKPDIRRRLTNLIFKADVLHTSDNETGIGCLRRKEKLRK